MNRMAALAPDGPVTAADLTAALDPSHAFEPMAKEPLVKPAKLTAELSPLCDQRQTKSYRLRGKDDPNANNNAGMDRLKQAPLR